MSKTNKPQKQMVTIELVGDWFTLAGMTKKQMLDYIKALPDNVSFDINYHGYDGADGVISEFRLETDEEFERRLAYENVQRQRELAAIQKQEAKRRKEVENKMKALEKEITNLKGTV